MARQPQTHETRDHTETVKLGSDRAFGIVFAVVFAIVALWPVINGGAPRNWALIVSAVFLVVSLARPSLLRPLNLLWFRFGNLLHKVVSPLILGLIFFVSVVPVALTMRVLGKDPLNLKFDPDAQSYWLERDPPGPTPESLKNQF
jgi:hypothetical protein